MKILFSFLIMFFSAGVYAQNSSSEIDITGIEQLLEVANPTCNPIGGSCRTFEDCCRGYCDGNHRCNDGGGVENPEEFAVSSHSKN